MEFELQRYVLGLYPNQDLLNLYTTSWQHHSQMAVVPPRRTMCPDTLHILLRNSLRKIKKKKKAQGIDLASIFPRSQSDPASVGCARTSLRSSLLRLVLAPHPQHIELKGSTKHPGASHHRTPQRSYETLLY